MPINPRTKPMLVEHLKSHPDLAVTTPAESPTILDGGPVNAEWFAQKLRDTYAKLMPPAAIDQFMRKAPGGRRRFFDGDWVATTAGIHVVFFNAEAISTTLWVNITGVEIIRRSTLDVTVRVHPTTGSPTDLVMGKKAAASLQHIASKHAAGIASAGA